MRDNRESDSQNVDEDFIFIEYGARKGSFKSAAPGAGTPSATPAGPESSETVGSGAAEEAQDASMETQMMLSNLAHTCSTYCELFNAMINVADRQIAKDQPSHAFFRSRADDPPALFPNPQESLRGCLRACSLYLHSLELFRNFMRLLDPHTLMLEASQIQIFKQVRPPSSCALSHATAPSLALTALFAKSLTLACIVHGGCDRICC